MLSNKGILGLIMATSDPERIPSTPKQQALSKAAAVPPEKRNPSHKKPLTTGIPYTPVKGETPAAWERQPDRQRAVGGEVRTDRVESFNRRDFNKQSEEQIKEIHKLTNILITAFHSCEMVIRFMNKLILTDKGERGLFEQTDIDDINTLSGNIKKALRGAEGLDLNQTLALQRAIKILALDIETITSTTTSVTLTDDELQSRYDENLKAVFNFAKENEITGTREVASSLTKETSSLVKEAGITVLKVLRPSTGLPIEVKKENITSPAPTETVATTSLKTPEENAAEKLAEEKERNRKIYERAKNGESFTVEDLKLEGYTEKDAVNVLRLLEIARKK